MNAPSQSFQLFYDADADILYLAFSNALPGFSRDSDLPRLYVNESQDGQVTGAILFDAHHRQDKRAVQEYLHSLGFLGPEVDRYIG